MQANMQRGIAKQSAVAHRAVGGRRGLRGVCRYSNGVESIEGVRQEVVDAISKATGNCLTNTDLKLNGKKYVGKVRDTYDLGDKIVIVTTDRQSAFDRILASIPFKGQVLNETSAWWMKHTTHIVKNALISTPDPNVAVMKKCKVFPVEFVCRGFMTGSTDTSLWTHYNAGKREYCGNYFKDNMRKNERLHRNVITPTTKAETHDVPISPKDIIAQGLMTEDEWEAVSEAALKLFAFGQKQSEMRGLLLVDTKYEFGKDENGEIYLIDEIHTPDSSRYWIAETYEARHAQNKEPENIDKEFLRLWFRSVCDPYKDAVLPAAPHDLVCELSKRYVYLYEKITGEDFQVPAPGETVNDRMNRNLRAAGL